MSDGCSDPVGWDKVHLNVGVEGTAKGFGNLIDKAGIPNDALDGFRLRASVGCTKYPISGVVGVHRSTYVKDDDKEVEVERKLVEFSAGAKVGSYIGWNNLNWGVTLDVEPVVLRWDNGDLQNIRSQLNTSVRLACFGSSDYRGCVDVSLTTSADWEREDVPETRVWLGVAFEHGDLASLMSPNGDWPSVLGLTAASLVVDSVYMGVAHARYQRLSGDAFQAEARLLDFGASPLLSLAKAALLDKASGKRADHALVASSLVVLAGTTELILGKVAISSDPNMNTALRQGGVNNMVIGAGTGLANVLGGLKISDDKKLPAEWALRLIIGLGAVSAGVMAELLGKHSEVNVAVQNAGFGLATAPLLSFRKDEW